MHGWTVGGEGGGLGPREGGGVGGGRGNGGGEREWTPLMHHLQAEQPHRLQLRRQRSRSQGSVDEAKWSTHAKRRGSNGPRMQEAATVHVCKR